MKCPHCKSTDSIVLETRESNGMLRRRRECAGCREKFRTYEIAAPLDLVRSRAGAVLVMMDNAHARLLRVAAGDILAMISSATDIEADDG